MKDTTKIIRYYYYRADDAETETSFNIEVSHPLTAEKLAKLRRLLTYAHERYRLSERSFLIGAKLYEVGPRLAFATADNSNALSILHSIGLTEVTRIEESRRSANGPLPFDRMTECVYPKPLQTFEARTDIESVYTLPFIEEGMGFLDAFNTEQGLALDNEGKKFCFDYFVEYEKRNPTNVEMLDLPFSLSEHSRHPFWNSLQNMDGKIMPETLFQIAKAPLNAHKGNDTGGFGDNAGIVWGFRVNVFRPIDPTRCSEYRVSIRDVCVTCALESHNHPSAVEPFQGAATGMGGIIRDLLTPGQAGDLLFLIAGYFGGNLLLKNFHIPGENRRWKYPPQFASPLAFLLKGNKGAKGYANEFGKPTIGGYTRAGGIQTPWGERRENIKPTLAAGGVGMMQKQHAFKKEPRTGMLIVRIGGPAYFVGLGGGSASSMGAGDNTLQLDFDSVQRGDAEMERRAYQAIWACTEMGKNNPFAAAHDQGGSGLGNMLKELLGKAGGKIHLRRVTLGDKTLPTKAIWSAEWQESFGFLVWRSRLKTVKRACKRENVPCDVLGEITGNGRIIVYDSQDGSTPVNMNLRKVLHDLPQKTFRSETPMRTLLPPDIDWNTPVEKLIRDVFRQLSVGSKGFLVNEKDRSVGGLVTRQQCCGPLQQPVADVAVSALSSRTFRGVASAIGEQPLKILVNPEAGGRMSLAEALLNLCASSIGNIQKVNLRANWMWAAKLPGEAPMLYRTADAARTLMIALGIRQNGGKDSSSKFARLQRKIIKAFGELIITAYAPVGDTRLTLTPDIKLPGESYLGYIDLGLGTYRLGGSALLQSRGQLGDECPDMDDPLLLLRVWNALQELIRRKLILSYHDRSDGGLIACLAEMVISGNCGAHILPNGTFSPREFVHLLFAEELGVVFEYNPKAHQEEIRQVFIKHRVPANLGFGYTTQTKALRMVGQNGALLDIPTPTLFNWWQATSARMEEEQMDPALAKAEARWNKRMVSPQIKLTFTPRETAPWILRKKEKPVVAVIREEGSNGHLEMASIIARAGMEPMDVMMNDLGKDLTSFARFRGMVFVGGFANRDRFGAGRGWHARISEQVRVRKMFETFKGRSNTWSLGVCNGCQLGALLGSAPFPELPEHRRPVLLRNKSGKFESRWTTVLIQKSPAIMFQEMEGTTFGIWEANGEGRFYFPDTGILEIVLKQNLVPMVYVDDTGGATMQYPCNSHGSPFGIAGLCSENGRHVIMMPHLERVETVLQCGYVPYRLRQTLKASPWLRPFQNLRAWCEQ